MQLIYRLLRQEGDAWVDHLAGELLGAGGPRLDLLEGLANLFLVQRVESQALRKQTLDPAEVLGNGFEVPFQIQTLKHANLAHAAPGGFANAADEAVVVVAALLEVALVEVADGHHIVDLGFGRVAANYPSELQRFPQGLQRQVEVLHLDLAEGDLLERVNPELRVILSVRRVQQLIEHEQRQLELVLVQQHLRADGVDLHGQNVLLHDEGHKGKHTRTATKLYKLLSLCMLLAFEQPLL